MSGLWQFPQTFSVWAENPRWGATPPTHPSLNVVPRLPVCDHYAVLCILIFSTIKYIQTFNWTSVFKFAWFGILSGFQNWCLVRESPCMWATCVCAVACFHLVCFVFDEQLFNFVFFDLKEIFVSYANRCKCHRAVFLNFMLLWKKSFIIWTRIL